MTIIEQYQSLHQLWQAFWAMYAVSVVIVLTRGLWDIASCMRRDWKSRNSPHYYPTATYGDAVRSLILAVVPVLNMCVALVVLFEWFGLTTDMIAERMRAPLIPAKPSPPPAPTPDGPGKNAQDAESAPRGPFTDTLERARTLRGQDYVREEQRLSERLRATGDNPQTIGVSRLVPPTPSEVDAELVDAIPIGPKHEFAGSVITRLECREPREEEAVPSMSTDSFAGQPESPPFRDCN